MDRRHRRRRRMQTVKHSGSVNSSVARSNKVCLYGICIIFRIYFVAFSLAALTKRSRIATSRCEEAPQIMTNHHHQPQTGFWFSNVNFVAAFLARWCVCLTRFVWNLCVSVSKWTSGKNIHIHISQDHCIRTWIMTQMKANDGNHIHRIHYSHLPHIYASIKYPPINFYHSIRYIC